MPSSKYNESIFTVAAMRSYATITVATLYYYYLVTCPLNFTTAASPRLAGNVLRSRLAQADLRGKGKGQAPPPPELGLRQVLGEDVWRL